MKIPEGTFTGIVHGSLFMQALGKVWTGKTFVGSKVTNRIFGRQMIEGDVSADHASRIVRIHYPQLGLTDELIDLFGDGERWAGRMQVGRWTVRFTLDKERSRDE